MSAETRERVLKLIADKERIENEIEQLTDVLKKHGIGMNEPLVDTDDFPLQDVDVYQVRQVRHRIICLQNDHKAIMKEIEAGLCNYYDPNNPSTCSSSVESMDVTPQVVETANWTPFAKVTLVVEGSPADNAGLKANDLIVQFGSVKKENFKSVMDIATVVQHSEGQKVNLKVIRGDNKVNAVLTPKKWHGSGLLGCSIVSV